MPRLKDLDAALLILDGKSMRHTDDANKAQGVWFACPLCFVKNKGLVGTHYVLCWFKDRGVSDEELPGPGRWTPSGTSLDDLKLTPSVFLRDPEGCGWHGHVFDGVAL